MATPRTRTGSEHLYEDEVTAQTSSGDAAHAEAEISLLTLGSVVLRRRRMIAAFGLLGVLVGLAIALIARRMYSSDATFIPQASDAGSPGSALAAQFGIRIPSSGSVWGPPMYIELLRSRAFLGPIALDTVTVAEVAGRRPVALLNLLGIEGTASPGNVNSAVSKLREFVDAREVRELGGVKLSVTTPWPSVSLALAERLVEGLNRFNIEQRQSQATAERRFVEAQAAEAQRALRAAEDRLQSFLQRNRTIAGSPELVFERDRLQREVALRQELQISLMKSREDARIREVRDIPVITILEEPRLPLAPKPRRSLLKALLGGFAGVTLGIVLAFIAHGLAGIRRTRAEDAREFLQLLHEATPRFLRRAPS